jgi:hypothetical protein
LDKILRRVFGASLDGGVRPGHPLPELPVSGKCERWTRVLVIPGGGVVVAQGVGDPLLEDILSGPPKD